MANTELKLKYPPIIEAVIDLDCDMPPGLEIATLEKSAFPLFKDQYPELRNLLVQEIETKLDNPAKTSVRGRIQALQFLHHDKKQIVQIRRDGFSFNRLSPYSGLDDYLPEFQRTWSLFCSLVSPVRIRVVRLRFINRILLPITNGKLELLDYLKLGPTLPDETAMTVAGFLNQYTAVENVTRNTATVVLTNQPLQNQKLPIIFDITAAHAGHIEVEDWSCIIAQIQLLRGLKNNVFKNTLSESCLNLFQQP